MKQTTLLVLSIVFLAGWSAVAADKVITPARISKEDISGKISDHPDMIKETHDGNTTLDVTTLLSSDKKFASGIYRCGKTRFEITETYGVDEFMFFHEGGVTLTSSDGSVQVIKAGEGVTIPREWTGVWETDGYTKIWVIYSEDGSGL